MSVSVEAAPAAVTELRTAIFCIFFYECREIMWVLRCLPTLIACHVKPLNAVSSQKHVTKLSNDVRLTFVRTVLCVCSLFCVLLTKGGVEINLPFLPPSCLCGDQMFKSVWSPSTSCQTVGSRAPATPLSPSKPPPPCPPARSQPISQNHRRWRDNVPSGRMLCYCILYK